MATAATLKFGSITLLLGDGATSEAFAAPCAVENLTKTTNVQTESNNIPDCADPDAPGWLVDDEVSKQITLSGDGFLDTAGINTWRVWDLAGGDKNVRWNTAGAAGAGGGYYTAPAKLTSFEEQGARGRRWRVSFTLALQGLPVLTPAA